MKNIMTISFQSKITQVLIFSTTLVFMFLLTIINSSAATLDATTADLVFNSSAQNNVEIDLNTSGDLLIRDSLDDIDTLTGTSSGCTLDTAPTPNQITCTGTVDSITINGSGLSDTITVKKADDPITINAGAGDDTINVKRTSDTTVINAGDGADKINLAESSEIAYLTGDITVNGDGGSSDELFIDDGNENDPKDYIISSTNVTRTGGDTITIDYATIEILKLDGGEDKDDIFIESIGSGVDATIKGGLGDDNFTIKDDTNDSLDFIEGNLEIDGNAGNDSVTFDDDGDDDDNDYEILNDRIIRNSTLEVLYKDFESIYLYIGDAANNIDVTSTHSNTDLFTLRLGNGDDLVKFGNVNNTMNDVESNFDINGEGGDDEIFINDNGESNSVEYIVNSTKISRDDIGILYLNVETLQIDAGRDDDTFNVKPHATMVLDLDGGSANSRGNVLNVDTDGESATDDGNEIEVNGKEIILYRNFEDIVLKDLDIEEEDTTNYDHPFADVLNTTFEAYIAECYNDGVCKGYEDGNFKPDDSIKRKELFSLLFRAFDLTVDMEGVTPCPDALEADVHMSNMLTLKKLGIIDGDSSGKCNPNAYITRGETAKVVYNMLEYKEVEVDDTYSYLFTDKVGNKFMSEIAWLAQEKVPGTDGETIVKGEEKSNGDKVFNWNATITRGQTAKIVVNSMKV